MNQTIKLNLIPNYNSLPQTVKLKQYDKTTSDVGKTLTFELYEADMPYIIPTDAVITVRGTKADKTGFEYECTYSGNQVDVNVQQQMTVFACKYDADLRITQNGNIIGTANFKIDVTESALADDTAISETELPLLEKAIEAETVVLAEVKKIQGESAQITQNKTDIATINTKLTTDESQIATNKSDIATNKSDIATNKSDIATNKSDIATNKSDIATNTSNITKKQDKLVSGTNIKTINSTSLLGSGNLNIVDMIYPVGSIYMSVNDVSPATLFGGTWEQLKDKFLVGAGNSYGVNSTGGSTSHSHTLSKNGYAGIGNYSTQVVFTDLDNSVSVVSYASANKSNAYGWTHNADTSTTTSPAKCVTLGGKTDTQTTLPPYLAVYMWKRTK